MIQNELEMSVIFNFVYMPHLLKMKCIFFQYNFFQFLNLLQNFNRFVHNIKITKAHWARVKVHSYLQYSEKLLAIYILKNLEKKRDGSLNYVIINSFEKVKISLKYIDIFPNFYLKSRKYEL